VIVTWRPKNTKVAAGLANLASLTQEANTFIFSVPVGKKEMTSSEFVAKLKELYGTSEVFNMPIVKKEIYQRYKQARDKHLTKQEGWKR
jgi:hypothetical protein